MKIRIRTSLVTLEIEDEPTVTNDGYTKRSLPELPAALKAAIDETLRLHNILFLEDKENK